jgi:surfeit locus 1 family protein
MNRSVRFGLITLASVLGIGVTASLGRWQLNRAALKLEWQAAIDRQESAAELDAAALGAAQDWAPLLHRRVRLRGTWLAPATVYLDNRQMQGRVGFFVVTPLQLEGKGGVVLVQRGWAARNFEDRTRLPVVDTPAGWVQVQGRMAPAPSQLYEPGRPGQGQIRQNLALVPFGLEKSLVLAPLTVQQTDPPSDGLLRAWPVVNLGVDKHYGYAAQWLGLATLIAVLYLWFQWVQPFIQRPSVSKSHA